MARAGAAVNRHWRVALRAVLVLTFTGCQATGSRIASGDAESTPVVVVRHAEKAPAPANDPVLSDIGIARATALDSAVRATPISDVVVSHLQRTRLTAAAVLARTGATLHVVPIGAGGTAAHVAAVADTVRAIAARPGHRGVLVVGHSNTVTLIVEALGGPRYAELCDSQYSQFFTVQLRPGSSPTSGRRTYGAADPVDAKCAGMMAPAR